MKNKSPEQYRPLRQIISISPAIKDLAQQSANAEFCGNLSAFIAHAIIHYNKCGACDYYKNALINNTTNSDGTKNTAIKQEK